MTILGWTPLNVLNTAPLKCCLNCILLHCSSIIWSFCSSRNHLTSLLLSSHILYSFLTLTFVFSFSPYFLKFCLSVFVLSGSSCPEGLHVRLSQRHLLHSAVPAVGSGEDQTADPAEQHAPRVRHLQPTCLLWPSLTVSRHQPAVRLLSFCYDLCLVLDVKA